MNRKNFILSFLGSTNIMCSKITINKPEPAGPTVQINNGGGTAVTINKIGWDTYLRFSLISSQLELVNSGKGIQQVAGGSNAFTKERFCWGFNEIQKGDRLIWKINANPNYACYVYLNEISYGFSNNTDEYAVNANIGVASQSKIVMRDRNSAGVEIGPRVDIAENDLCCLLFNVDNTVSLQKWNGTSWDTLSTSGYVTSSNILYAGIKTFRPEAGVNEIYVNTAAFHNYPTPLTPKKGTILGDSTMDYCGTYVLPVDTQFYTVQERLAGYELVVLADGGDTIAQQKTVWTAYADKASLDFVIIQLGLNNFYYLEGNTNAQDIAALQDLVDTVAANVPGIPIILCTMVPAKGRWFDVIWPDDAPRAANAQASWEALNAAIRGEGGSPITGVDARVSQHTIDLDDGTGYLVDAYQIGDEIHTNGLGREINIGHVANHNYTAIRAALKTLNIIT